MIDVILSLNVFGHYGIVFIELSKSTIKEFETIVSRRQ